MVTMRITATRDEGDREYGTCIDPNGGGSRSLVKSMHRKERVRWRVNEVNVSMR